MKSKKKVIKKAVKRAVKEYIKTFIALKEPKLSYCCGAEITETGFCKHCKDNC